MQIGHQGVRQRMTNDYVLHDQPRKRSKSQPFSSWSRSRKMVLANRFS
uniref:Uncharacterized protein n=1 Tax=Triticum urartu TaxID=4572 RepID=A0A8R7R4B4_TRIUA